MKHMANRSFDFMALRYSVINKSDRDQPPDS